MKMFVRFSPRWLLSVLLCLTVVPAYAADQSQNQNQWYAVELIVFAQTHPDAGNETWPATPGLPNLTGAQDIPTVAVAGSPLQPLPADQFKLQAEADKLANDSDYEVLLHTGWVQLGVPGGKGIPVRIHTALPAAADDAAPATPAAVVPATPAGSVTPAPAAATPVASAPDAQPRLDGVVTLTLSRYLHLDVDLVLRGEPAAPADSGGFFGTPTQQPQVQLYRLQESRRMRSKEIHYFDHPMFGVLAQVTPYDPSAIPGASPAATPAPAAAAPTVTPIAPAAAGSGNGGTIQRGN